MQEILAANLENCLFTSSRPDELLHNSVVVFDEKHCATYRHGPHSALQLNQKVALYSLVNQHIKKEATVCVISESHDLVVMKLSQDDVFSSVPSGFGAIFRGQSYKQICISPTREPSWKDGTISAKRVGFYFGTSHGKVGDSGSGIFDVNGYFLGLAIGKRNFVFRDQINMQISEIADHHPDVQIIGADSILSLSGIVGDDFSPPAT